MAKRITITLLAVILLSVTVGLPSATTPNPGVPVAQAFVGDQPSWWRTMLRFMYDSEASGTVFGTEALSGEEQIALLDVVCGVFAEGCLGGLAVAALGAVAIPVLLQTGLGKAFGSWLANLGNAQVSANLASEKWCPETQATYGGQTASGATSPSCNALSSLGVSGATFAMGDGVGSISPPSASADLARNYWTLTWLASFSGGCDFEGSATSSSTAWIINPALLTGGVASAVACMNAVYSGYTTAFAGAGNWNQLTYNNATQIGTGGPTCKTIAMNIVTSSTNYTGQCYAVYANEDQMATMLGSLKVEPCGNTGMPTCPTSSNTPGLLTVGSTTGATGCGGTVSPCVPVLNKVDGGPEVVTEPPVNCYVLQTCTPGGNTLTLPRPLITETYDQYINRLRNLGFWGHIYTVDDDMDYPAGTPAYLLNPKQITEVGVGTSDAIPLYWPAPGHGLAGAPSGSPDQQGQYHSPQPGGEQEPPGTTITIEKVPDSWGGGGGGGGPCNCPGLDFSKLTGLSYGSTFPFGAFVWLSNSVSSFAGDTTGTPIVFTIPVGTTPETVTLGSSQWVSTYRPIVFPIVEFLMTLAAVLWFAFRVVGHPGGDGEGTE